MDYLHNVRWLSALSATVGKESTYISLTIIIWNSGLLLSHWYSWLKYFMCLTKGEMWFLYCAFQVTRRFKNDFIFPFYLSNWPSLLMKDKYCMTPFINACPHTVKSWIYKQCNSILTGSWMIVTFVQQKELGHFQCYD